MNILKRALKLLSWLFFAAGVVWIFFGPNLVPVEDCDPRAFFGCGVLDIGVSGVIATVVNFAGKAVCVLLLWSVWALLHRAATGRWPSLPGDSK